jgi:hypothetical protein
VGAWRRRSVRGTRHGTRSEQGAGNEHSPHDTSNRPVRTRAVPGCCDGWGAVCDVAP